MIPVCECAFSELARWYNIVVYRYGYTAANERQLLEEVYNTGFLGHAPFLAVDRNGDWVFQGQETHSGSYIFVG